MQRGNGAGFYGPFSGRSLSISLGKYAKGFQAKMYAILFYAF
jgi:preprotein translocase subunit SecG